MLRGLGVLLILVVILASQTIFIVDETKQAIVLQFGDPIRNIRDPGLATKLPFVQNVIYFEKRVLSSDAPPQEYLTTDKKRLVVDHVTRWRIADPLLFFKTVSTEARARARLDDIVFSELRRELATVNFVDVISQERENIMESVTRSSAEKAKEFGIELLDVRIQRADLPEVVQQSVFNRMRAERQRESSLFRAEGEEQAAIIRARADRNETVILAEGYREAQRLRGEGEAMAISIYAQALEQDPEFYAFWRRLQAYKTTLKAGDTLVIPADSDFFRYLINTRPGTASDEAGTAGEGP
ncbi:MAG TPA: protease modulator HflC [Caldilineae bacterium]|nr:protease modulator HflC [Caldilineae bacterium]